MPVSAAKRELELLRPPADAEGSPGPELPVSGRRMRPIVERLRIYASLPETLLIAGPTGAGKSRLARWVHQCSPRAAHELVTVDLLTIPRDMQMAELFGWRRGAFTGAVRDQDSAVARAGEGTLFIDEIDKLSLACQAGLLRLLEERCYRVLGDRGTDLRCDARIVAGTNVDLRRAVTRGEFREDLYYRLNVLVTELPGLDERRDEIPAWADFMAARRRREAGDAGPGALDSDACARLAAVSWPGNLRQLDNVIRRAWALGLTAGRATISLSDVDLALADEAGAPTHDDALSLLVRAAEALVDEQLRRPEHQRLGLDDLDVFRGFVLERASARLGELGDAYCLFGA
ncbi:MAG TPA: sigma 54-interacting transcriptional regulator, partial [Enhygromyxa sp.]|nr:sigma 54-interacting transcriptional regulator [Enhygromyxa sp.]